MKAYVVNKDFRVTIPRAICARLGVKPGDKIQLEAQAGGSVKLIPLKKLPTHSS